MSEHSRNNLSEKNNFFYHEMMVHPVLFTHPHPQKIVVIGKNTGILHEAVKHPSVSHIDYILDDPVEKVDDHRIQYHIADSGKWLAAHREAFDIIIQTELVDDSLKEPYDNYCHALRTEGILVKPCLSALFHLAELMPIYQHIKQAGFNDWQVLNFPQPNLPTGWLSAIMATKHFIFKRIHEREIFNRPFTTRYYNFDVHKASLVLPQFVLEELERINQ